MLLIGIFLFILTLGLGVAIGRAFADDPEEESLLWKLAGYAFLGFFTLTLNRLPLPFGYVVALWLSTRPERNRGARRAAATVTFLLWLGGLIFR